MTVISDNAFRVCSSLTSVDASLCNNLEYIGSAFDSCPAIKEFLLGASNPPELRANQNGRPFETIPDAVLKVPAESVEAYKNSDWADYFGTIEAL